MNKKILIGSIISVVILILVSFTSVVGYNNIESDFQSSPLFNIRSRRAIEEESGDFRCEYVGKRNTINLLIPKRNSEIEFIVNMNDLISKMDDDTFNRFIKNIKSIINRDNRIENSNLFLQMLYQLRRNSKEKNTDILKYNVDYFPFTDNLFSWCNWEFGCILYDLIFLFGLLISIFLEVAFIFIISALSGWDCTSQDYTCVCSLCGKT
jgi:hypothetical protein